MKHVIAWAFLGLGSCTHGEPPGAASRDGAAAARDRVTAEGPVPVGAVARDGSTAPTTAPSVGASAGVPSATDDAASSMSDAGSLVATDGAEPQTDARPDPADPLTTARAKAFFDAIVADAPAGGEVFFFPLAAYRQVKDSSNPEADWKGRLLAAYGRDLHEIRRARPSLQGARFLGLEIPEAAVRWVKPGEEYNKLGYFRVFGSQLAYETASGERRTIPLKSLISWRGRFYLVHLSSFK